METLFYTEFDVNCIQILNEGRSEIRPTSSIRYELFVDTNYNDSGYHLHVRKKGESKDLFSINQDGSMHDEHLIQNSGFRFSKTFIKTIKEIQDLQKYNFQWNNIPNNYLLN